MTTVLCCLDRRARQSAVARELGRGSLEPLLQHDEAQLELGEPARHVIERLSEDDDFRRRFATTVTSNGQTWRAARASCANSARCFAPPPWLVKWLLSAPWCWPPGSFFWFGPWSHPELESI